jgi:hypothetical protein
MQLTYINSFSNFPDESEVWIYAADRFMGSNEVAILQENLSAFTEEWKTHGKSLRAEAQVFDNVFVVFATDIHTGSASGCSIDTSVRLMKQLGSTLGIDFFNRLKVLVRSDEQLKHVSYHNLTDFAGNEFADISIKSLGQFRSAFFTPIQ